MNFTIVLKLLSLSLVSVGLSVIFFLLKRLTSFGKAPYWVQQIVIGLFFGAAAIFGTEFGVDVGGATANARDAAPLCAGLIFGAPSGIIAGVIGGVERWFAVAWGAGMYSRLACSVSTILAGIYAAYLRKYLFDNRRPAWLIGCAGGIVMETFHMTMLFLTKLNDTEKAYEVIKICTIPMMICTAAGIALSIVFVNIISHFLRDGKKRYKTISDKVQVQLLIVVTIGYLLTTGFIFALQTGTAVYNTKTLMSVSIDDLQCDIEETTDREVLKIAKNVKSFVESSDEYDPDTICQKFGISEFNVVSKKGIITESNVPEYIGFDMTAHEQSSEFMCLVGEEKEFVQKIRENSYSIDISGNDLLMKYAGVSLSKGGFLQVGYDMSHLQSEILNPQMKDLTRYRHISESGFIVIADTDESIISSDETHRGKTLKKAGIDLSNMENPGELFKCTVFGEPSYCMCDTSEGYLIIPVIPSSEVFYERDTSVYVNSFMEVFLFAVFFALTFTLIKSAVVRNLNKVNVGLDHIMKGNFSETVDVHPTEEFAMLSDNINKAVGEINRFNEEQNARIKKDLDMATNIQLSALPSVFPAFPGHEEFDIYATMNTAKEVGGDFYDFYLIGKNKLAFVIADVSGKGVPAALFMMRAKTMLKNLAETSIPVNMVMSGANDKLCEGNDAGMFVTAWMGILDLTTGHVKFANAGHNPPLVYRKGQGFEYLRSKAGFVLAGMEGLIYKLQEFDLAPGDRLYLYTDGVTEATNTENSLYGEDRLLSFLNSHTDDSLKDCLLSVKADIDEFAGEAEQFDDITMLMVEYKGLPEDNENMISKTFRASDEDLDKANAFVEEMLEKHECSMKSSMQIMVALEELFVNVAHYAYGEGEGDVAIALDFDTVPGSVRLSLSDGGIPFDPLAKEDPDVTLSAEDRKIGGLGIFMVKKSMDKVEYEYKDGKNITTIQKTL